jgi:hypothetical protein
MIFKGIFMLRTNVDKMNVEPIDLGHKLRQGVQLCLDLAPVVILRPIARGVLNHRKLNALRFIRDGLLLRPPGRCQASAQIDERLFRDVDAEGADRIVSFCGERGCRGRKADGAGCRGGEDGAPIGFGHVIQGTSPELGEANTRIWRTEMDQLRTIRNRRRKM